MTKEKHIISGYPLILNYLGIFSMMIGLIILTPLILVLFWPQEISQVFYFLIPSVIAFAFGGIITLLFRGREKGKLERHHDAILVVSTWLLAITISAMPFVMSGQFTFTQSLFEATSGYSTTGLTVVDVENISHIFLLFRSLMQLFGGVGLVLLLTSFVSDKFGMRLYSAEGHGDKLMPNLIRSARTILSIYLFYILLGIIAYVTFGMSVFDAVNHSISAVATGGFSTRAESIGYYNSVPIEITTIVLMILGGTNFFVHLLIMKRKFNLAFRHVEMKFLGILALLFVPLFVLSLMRFSAFTFGEAMRVGIFHFVSAITTTGLQTISSVNILPSSFFFPMLILMMIGASTGSTAGGMKLYRVSLALKSVFWNLKDTLGHKKTIRPHFINKLGTKRVVEKDEIGQNYAFLMIYILIQFTGITIFTLSGYGVVESIFEFTSTLGTIGLSTGIFASNPSNIILWTGIIGMLIARLESYVIIIAIAKVMIDVKKHITQK